MIRCSLLTVAALFAACQSSPMANGAGAEANAAAQAAEAAYDKPGFVTKVVGGRLWVFAADSADYADFCRHGEPTKSVNRIGAGPNGMTVRAPDFATIDAYTLAKAGFVTKNIDGRIWVFAAGSKDYDDFCKTGEPAKCVTRIGAGPNGETIRSTDAAVIDAWLAAK